MTIDERLEKLTERQEAMAQSMEVLQGMQMDNERRFETITHNFEVVLDSLKSLERTASAHEARISHLEGD
jgi:hypothetical protein